MIQENSYPPTYVHSPFDTLSTLLLFNHSTFSPPSIITHVTYRELEKEINSLQNNEKKLVADIKKNAKMNQMGPVRIMAKDLVRTRNYVSRFTEMKTTMNAVSLKLQTVKSNEAMTSALKGVTSALKTMNKQVSLPGLQKIMQDFARENEQADLTQEMIGDTIDDAMAEDGSELEVIKRNKNLSILNICAVYLHLFLHTCT